jgi:hypothetical protein
MRGARCSGVVNPRAAVSTYLKNFEQHPRDAA